VRKQVGRRGVAGRIRGTIGLALAAWALAGAPVTAEERPTVVVTDPTGKAYRVALQTFADLGPRRDAARVRRLREVLAESLEFSGLFTPIDPAAFLGPVESEGLDARIACSDWSQIRADALVQGEVRAAGEGLAVEYRVVDVARGCRSLRRHRYRGRASDVVTVGRRMADDVVAAFTGKPGVASTEISFVSNRNGTPEIFLMDATGGNVRPITKTGSINQFPSWHPDGDEIVYTSYRDDGRPHIFVLARVGRSGRILRALPSTTSHYRATFAPDGRKLALVAKSAGEGASEIYTVDRRGRGVRQLTRNRSIDVSPSWSPDGEWIAFVSDRSGSPQIYVMKADGTSERRITFNGGYNTSPAWSPDGRWIAYEARVGGGQFDLWLVDPEGGTNLPLVSHPRSDEGPSWSPDGRKIVFSSSRRGNHDLYMIDVSGENLRRITTGAGDDKTPSWGPYPR
jgi:TolB protein